MCARQSAPLPSLWVTCEGLEHARTQLCEESIQCIRNRARAVTLSAVTLRAVTLSAVTPAHSPLQDRLEAREENAGT